MISGGGLIAATAFFLPWVAVSCDGTVVKGISPHERASGFGTQEILDRVSEIQHVQMTQFVDGEPFYWLLLFIPTALAAIGLVVFLARGKYGVQLPATGLAGAIVGIAITVKKGLVDLLEIRFDAPDIDLLTESVGGPWIAIAGYVLALCGALITLVAGKELD
jgi:hypothetical protein